MSSERRDEVNDRLPTARLGEGAVVWFTGLSGSGKTTVAQAVDELDPDTPLLAPSVAYWPDVGDFNDYYAAFMPLGGHHLFHSP